MTPQIIPFVFGLSTASEELLRESRSTALFSSCPLNTSRPLGATLTTGELSEAKPLLSGAQLTSL
jgi:hypothetical protein